MDIREHIVVDFQRSGKDAFITQRVVSIRQEGRFYWVKFEGSDKVFKFRNERLFYKSGPERINIEGKGLYVKKMHITNADEVLKFSEGRTSFWLIIYKNGLREYYYDRDVYVSRTDIKAINGGLWDFLNHFVEETGLQMQSEDNDKTLNLLKMQYQLVDPFRDSTPLSLYFKGNRCGNSWRLPSYVFYPFGCNASQKKAVENALSNQISIIQGPPGTGKTQTILNIISNLLMKDKTVLVVSNNNSAVDSVAEKLSSEKVGLGFIVAKLGNKDNRTRFIANQPVCPDMSEWELENKNEAVQQVKNLLDKVTKGFENQTLLAQLRKELAELETEQKYQELQTGQSPVPWLELKPSKKILGLLVLLRHLSDEGRRISLLQRIRWCFNLGFKTWGVLKSSNRVDALESAYYQARKREISAQIAECEDFLKTNNINECVEQLRSLSLDCLKSYIAGKYKGKERTIFTKKTIKDMSRTFLEEYPVVLSTTFSAKSCISEDMVFDYVIMDEASQVDIATGALALSCGENIVIVGDDKQLPNVIDSETYKITEVLERLYSVDDKYRITLNSFLGSCNKVFCDAPSSLLREHYRCHPKIIGFCNKMFYDDELITMTNDDGTVEALSVFLTVPGNHARGHVNQREIDVIRQEVMPELGSDKTVGIITPYRDQASMINEQLQCDIASTVHKYQGKECDAIIMSMVDNRPTSFSDDPNLLNVAISRAKSKLCIVASGNELPAQSILSQLIEYIRYNNFEVTNSKLHSVFDILYKQYNQERLDFINAHPDADELSESVVFEALKEALEQMGMDKRTGILCHYPIHRLIADKSGLTEEELEFVGNALSHVDFLIYNTITKRPQLCLEVDGWKYHNTDVQRHRDKMKDAILAKYNLPIKRLPTNSIVTVETLKSILQQET